MAMKKGIFFTIDALLASGIIIIAILLISNFYSVEHQKYNVNYASQDLVNVFSSISVGEVDNDYVKSLIASGDITNTNNSILEQIGNFWADENPDLALNFIKNLTETVIPSNYGFSVLVNGEEIYSRNLPIKRVLVSSRKIISGIAKAKPTEGFTARVLLNGIKSKKTNAYVYFGGYEGDGNLTKILVLPNDISSFNSSYLEVGAGSTFDLYINNMYSGTYAKGSGGGGEMFADKWNISNAYLSNFMPGTNIININFTSGNNSIGGGFLRVTYITSSYNDTQTPGYEKYMFPGIDGVINLYSSVYMPGPINNMQVFINYSSNYTLLLRLGNKTIYETNSNGTIKNVTIANSTLRTILDYDSLNQKTTPLRLVVTNATALTSETLVDTVLITDRTGSMSACDVLINCSSGICDSNPSGGCHQRRDYSAISSDKNFIDTVLENPSNKVALIGYGSDASPVCDFYDFSSDNASLKYRVSNYTNSWCGATCISCGIFGATQLLTENEMLYSLNEVSYANATQFRISSSNRWLTERFNMGINSSRFVKSRLTLFTNDAGTRNNDFKNCVYFNGIYIGRMCQSSSTTLGWHTCSYPLKPEWFLNTSTYNITITGGNTAGCFGTSGSTGNFYFKDVKLTVWETKNDMSNFEYNVSSKEVRVGNSPSTLINTSYINISFDKTKSKSANLEFEAIDVNPSYYDCVYVNGEYLGRVDYQKWNGTNVWQKVIFDVPLIWLKNGTNQINITGGSIAGCKSTLWGTDSWRFRNLNLSIRFADEPANYNRFKSMLVMSDGGANTAIGGISDNDEPYRPSNETIKKACEAHNLYGINIYTVAFGDVEEEAIDTLNKTACCDDCSHFYTSSNYDELVEIYTKIAQAIINLGFQEQTLISAGIAKTVLYPNSYIEFNYSTQEFPFNKIPLTFETDRFGNNISSGTLTIYPNTSVSDARVTSYSGSKWTDNLVVNGNPVYRLSDYGDDYYLLGDPFAVNIPVSNINQGTNTVTISTGLNSSKNTGGSNDSKVIYTLLLKGSADYSGVLSKGDGCSWTVSFEDGTFSTMKVPSSYSGADTCSFTPLSKNYDTNDALDNAVYELFSNLDIDKDGKLDIIIEENDLDISSVKISKVPSLWGPAIIEIRVWE